MPFADSPIRATRHRRPVRRVVVTAAVVVLALVATGCGAAATPSPSVAPIATPVVTPAPTPTAAPTATPTPTATPVASQAATGRIVTDAGFAITLPNGWKSIPVDPAQLQAFLEGLPKGSELRTLLESQAGAVQQAIKFWAFDVRPEDTAAGFARNVNVIVQPPSGMSLGALEGLAKASLESISAVRRPVKTKLVELPAGPALRLDYILDVAGANGNVPVAGTQYYVQLPNATLIVSFTSDLASTAAATKDFEAIADSIEAVP